jgi:hypothetical protein
MLCDPMADGMPTTVVSTDLIHRVNGTTARGVAHDTSAVVGLGGGRREDAQGAECSDEDEDVFHGESGIREPQTRPS